MTIVNPFPNKPLFLCVCNTSLLKTVRKGEIACKELFHLFPQCFLPFSLNSKLLSANSKISRFGELINQELMVINYYIVIRY